jgi:hypothetical protein
VGLLSKVPFSQRKPGDAVFFTHSSSCEADCKSKSAYFKNIHHVGIVSNNVNKFWSSPQTKETVKEAEISNQDTHCASVIRFA